MSDTIVRELRLRRFETAQREAVQPSAGGAGLEPAAGRDSRPAHAPAARLARRHSRRRALEL